MSPLVAKRGNYQCEILALAGTALAAIATQAAAQDAVSLASAVFVERIGHTQDGRVERRIEPAKRLTRGDKVVLMVEWRAAQADKGFAVTSPIPRTLAFQEISLEGAEVSVNGGRSWGRIGELVIRDGDGDASRFAGGCHQSALARERARSRARQRPGHLSARSCAEPAIQTAIGALMAPCGA